MDYPFSVPRIAKLAMEVSRHIHSERMMHAGDRIGIAVSGGADSVALLRLLLEVRERMGLVLAVVHFNHKLRGTESNADARFVAALAKDHGLRLHTASVDTSHYAKKKSLGIEAAARELRYGFFHKLVRGKKSDHIATAHTLDDQAETVLFRLLRGAGTRGLAGILPKTREGVVRPLLGVHHEELLTYLQGLGQAWREDSSNIDMTFTRNKIRHELLPMLETEYNPNLKTTLSRTAHVARMENEYFERTAEALLPSMNVSHRLHDVSTLDGKHLMDLQPVLRRRLLMAYTADLGITLEHDHIERLLEMIECKGKSCQLPGGWCAVRTKELVFFKHIRPSAAAVKATKRK